VRGVAAHQIWLMLQHLFIDNSEMHALHLDTTFRNFVQGDLSVSDYCHKIKRMTDSLDNISCVVFDHNLILNVLQGLNRWYVISGPSSRVAHHS
jgi:hypothetical protein